MKETSESRIARPRTGPDGAGRPVDYEHRTTVNLMAVIAILLLGAGVWLTMNYISESRRLDRCVGTGRRDCFVVPDPQSGRLPPQS